MPNHSIVHVDVPSHDLEAAGKFYAGLFCWTIQPMPEFNYALFDAPPGPGGGFVTTADETADPGPMSFKPGEVLVYVSTNDIDATLARVESLGGRPLLPKTEIPGIGWYGVFADPTGNRIGLYTGMNPQS